MTVVAALTQPWAARHEQRSQIDRAAEHAVGEGAVVQLVNPSSRTDHGRDWKVVGVDRAGDRHRHPTLWLIDWIGCNGRGYRSESSRNVIVVEPTIEHAAIREALLAYWKMLDDLDAATAADDPTRPLYGAPRCRCGKNHADHLAGCGCASYDPRPPLTFP